MPQHTSVIREKTRCTLRVHSAGLKVKASLDLCESSDDAETTFWGSEVADPPRPKSSSRKSGRLRAPSVFLYQSGNVEAHEFRKKVTI
jgi:hypothetical protein